MSGVTTEAESLLAAGAVLPPDTDGAGEQAVPLTGRTYRHPVLDDRVVVRLVDADLGVGEDAAMGFLGLEQADEPVTVGLGVRQALGFPEWVLVHHPDDGHHALAVMPELERIAKVARSKPKAAVDDYHALAGRLARSVPHFLPTFYEQAGRVFVSVDQDAYASQMFTRARKMEAEHGLDIDPDRLDGVYLEFALAGALSSTALTGYAKDLAARLPADQALDRFCRLGARSAAAGVVPSVQMANAMRRLIRAAGKAGGADGAAAAQAREWAYLTELLGLPLITEAPSGWWTANLPTLTALAEHDPSVRGTLLNLMPSDRDELAQWLQVLTESGAVTGLTDGDLPAAVRPEDGSVGWLTRFLKVIESRYYNPPHIPALYELVERMAAQLRAELAATGGAIDQPRDIDLLDLLLSLDVPVAVAKDSRLDLGLWARREGQRDLVALAGDARFRSAAGASISEGDNGRHIMQQLAATPGGSRLLGDWLRAKVTRPFATGLPHLPEALKQVAWWPAEALRLVADEVATAAGADLAEHIARSLRGGIFDELGWPAWEEALAYVEPGGKGSTFIQVDAWPYLIVAGATRVCVIDADGIVLRHDLRIPANDVWGQPGFHYVDGELLVYWDSRELDGHLRGYWHSSAEAPQPLLGDRSRNQPRTGSITLPLPGGGRTTGAGVLHAGDTAVPDEQLVSTDGTSYWVWLRGDDDTYGWHEYDPASGAYGRRGLPGFLADALTSAPADSTLWESQSWLRPALSDRASPLAAPVDGMLGWRVVKLPDGLLRGEDLAGRTVTVAKDLGVPVDALTLPGDDRPRALLDDYRIVDPDGVVSAAAGPPSTMDYTPKAISLPWRRFAGNLQPRDPAGSVALRQLDRDTAATLLKAAIELVEAERIEAEKAVKAAKAAKAAKSANPGNATSTNSSSSGAAAQPDQLIPLIRAVLPQISHDALLAGVAGVVRFAARLQSKLDALTKRLAKALAGDQPKPRKQEVTGPTDRQLFTALDGLTNTDYWRVSETKDTFRQLQAIGEAKTAPAAPDPAIELHFDGSALPETRLHWRKCLDQCGAVAYRAAAATTSADDQDTLRAFLAELDGLGLATATEPATWRRFSLSVDESRFKKADGSWRKGNWRGILPLADGAFLAVLNFSERGSRREFTTLFHDPSGGFDVPAPYQVESAKPVGEERPAGWLAAFLAEWAERGPVPWQPAAVDKFADLTGVTPTVAKLVLAGMPQIDSGNPLSAEARKTLGVKATEVRMATSTLHGVAVHVRRAVVGALLPAEPAKLWTDGPDVAAAATVWNEAVGRQVAVPEQLLADAITSVRTHWGPEHVLPALLDPAAAPPLTNDLTFAVSGDRVRPVDQKAVGFAGWVLTSVVPVAAWTAHQVPVGDPVRTALPAALAALKDRLANPELILDVNQYVRLSTFRQVAGTPSETGDGWERYGAVVLSTYDDQSSPGLRVSLLDATGSDPYLPALRGSSQQPFGIEVALRVARDPRFAALLADPGDPVAGTRNPDGTWWPQDPTRSVPELVAEVAAEHTLGADAAATYLMLLAMPDPTDRNVARWTGWKPARLKAARDELAGTDLVLQATRSRAGRSLFLPGVWLERKFPHAPIEQWKILLFELPDSGMPQLGVTVPFEPVPDLYRRAWQRLRDGDVPRFEELRTGRATRR